MPTNNQTIPDSNNRPNHDKVRRIFFSLFKKRGVRAGAGPLNPFQDTSPKKVSPPPGACSSSIQECQAARAELQATYNKILIDSGIDLVV